MVDFRFQESLHKYLPNIFSLLISEPDWEKINVQLNEDHEKRVAIWDKEHAEVKNPENKDAVLIDAPLYYLFHLANRFHPGAIFMLDYFNIVFREIPQTIPSELLTEVSLTVHKVLKTVNRDYIHYIAELAVLDSIMKTNIYKLDNLELHLGNGKHADFCVTEIESGIKYLVEVVNIHIDEDEPDPVGIRRKLQKKVNKKLKNGSHNFEFLLIPVLWAKSFQDLQILEKKISEWKKFKVDKTYEPFGFCAFIEKNLSFSYRFQRLSNLFK